jgi:hypothetical protein
MEARRSLGHCRMGSGVHMEDHDVVVEVDGSWVEGLV